MILLSASVFQFAIDVSVSLKEKSINVNVLGISGFGCLQSKGMF